MKHRPHKGPKKGPKVRSHKPHSHKSANPSSSHSHGPQKAYKRPTLYGFHAVREAWLNPERVIEALYLTDQAIKGFESTVQEAKGLGLRRPEPEEIEKGRLEKLLPQGAVHQGVALAAQPLEECDLSDLIVAANGRPRTVLAMLDQVTDPHNVGAILRSACVFGLNGLIQQKKHAPELDGVVAKTACGAVEHVRVAYATNLSRALEDLKESGFTVIGLDERGEQTLGEVRPVKRQKTVTGPALLAPPAKEVESEKVVLVLGSEGEGIRRLIRENCDVLARLPAPGPIKSLNVSNAAAAAFYALLGG